MLEYYKIMGLCFLICSDFLGVFIVMNILLCKHTCVLCCVKVYSPHACCFKLFILWSSLFIRAISQPLDLIMATVDIKGTIKDFCSVTCLSSFKSNSGSTQTLQATCSTCNKSCTVSRKTSFQIITSREIHFKDKLFVVLTALWLLSSTDYMWVDPLWDHPQVLQRPLLGWFPQEQHAHLWQLQLHLPQKTANAGAGEGDQDHLQWKMFGRFQRGAQISKLWSLRLTRQRHYSINLIMSTIRLNNFK